MTPRRDNDKHARITDAAVRVFAERGYHNTRVHDIAEAAGVADGTIYLYFRNKEDILLSVFEREMDALLGGLTAALDGLTCPKERLRVFARHHFSQVHTNRAVAEVLQVELRLSNKFLKEYRPEKLWSYLGVLGNILKDGKQLGVFRSTVDPFLLKWAFFGALDELAVQYVLTRKPERFRIDAAADEVADVFLSGLLCSPEPSSPQASLEEP